MAKSITEIRRIGTCRVNYGGRDLGYTQGGVSVSIVTDWVDINVDDFGTVPVDAQDVGTNIEATVPLAQASIANYRDAFPTARDYTPGDTGWRADRVTFGQIVGESITKKRLILDPINDTDNIVIYLAGVILVDDLGFNNDGIRILSCHFRGYVDTGRSEGDKTFRIGGYLS